MSKIAKKKKSDKVNLAVKVHSSSTKAIRRKSLKTISSQSSQEQKKKKNPKRKKRIFKKQVKKSKGLLSENLEKKKKPKIKKLKEKIQADEQIDKTSSFFEYDFKEEKAKKLLMRSGVTFFMLLIFIMWIYNTKRSIVSSAPKSEDANILELDSWQDIREDLSEKMQEIKNKDEDEEDEINMTAVPTNDLINISTSSEQIEKLKEGMNKILK